MVVVALQVSFVKVDFLENFFGVDSVSTVDLLYLFLYSASVLVIMDAIKVVIRLFNYMRRNYLSKSSYKCASPSPEHSRELAHEGSIRKEITVINN